MNTDRIYTAAVVIIGNEVLSGRVQEANLRVLAVGLNERGIRLKEARVIADDEATIVATVNTLRAVHDYVFTTGGIGPTHDDITAASVAAAFGVPLVKDPHAVALLERHYGDRVNAARLRMAMVPAGARLLDNPVAWAPGFALENVYVLPGVPRIAEAMFDTLKSALAGGQPLRSRTVNAYLSESLVAEGLAAIQARFTDTEIGSYPYVRNERFGCALVVRGVDTSRVEAASAAIAALVRDLGGEPEVVEGEGGSVPGA